MTQANIVKRADYLGTFLGRLSGVRTAALGREGGVRARLLSGVFWTLVVTVVGQGCVFAATILSARLLGRQEYGKLAVIQGVVFMLANVAAMGLGTTATKFVSELHSRAPHRVGRVLGICSLTTLVTGAAFAVGLAVAAPWIASDLLHAPELRGLLQLGAVYVFFSALNSYQIGALGGFEAFSRLAWVNTLRGPVVLLLTGLLTWSLGLIGAVLATGAAMVCSWGLHQQALRAECRRRGIAISYDHLRQEFAALIRFAIPATASGHIGGLAIVGASTLLVRQPGGFAQMAVFSAAEMIRTILLLAPGMVASVASPVLCNLRAAGDLRRYWRAFGACLALNSGLTALAALAIFPFAPLLLSVFGSQFAHGENALRTLLVAAVVEVIAVSEFQVLYSLGKMWTKCAVQIVWAACLLGGTWCFTFDSGSVNLAAAYLAAWISSLVFYAAVIWWAVRGRAIGGFETSTATIR